MNRVNLKLKIWLVLSLLMAMMLAVFAVIDHGKAVAAARADMRRQAIELRAVLMATRRIYQQQFLASELPVNEKTLGFLPAHALSRISADFHNWTRSRLHFNNVSDRPRNPANQADTHELAAIAWHRQHPQAVERIADIHAADGQSYLHYTAPIWIEPYCLQCHANEEQAPESIRRLGKTAFGYRLGDLRGVMSIKVPSQEVNARALAQWRSEWLEKTGMLLTLLIILGLLMNRLVIRRLDRLRDVVKRIATGDYHARYAPAGAPTGGDEIDLLGRGFDQMAAAVLERDRSLADSEARNRVLVELAPVGLFHTDAAGGCTYVNERWQQIAGLDAAAARGAGWVNALHPDDRQRIAAEWQAAADSGQPFHSEYRFQNASGVVTWVLGQAREEFGADGKLVGYIGTITDINARKRAEELEHYSAFQAGIAEMGTAVLHNIGNAITAITQDSEALSRASAELARVADLLTENASQASAQLRAAPDDAAPLAARQCAVQQEAARVIDDLCQHTLQPRSRHMAEGVCHIADIVRIQQNAAQPGSQSSSFSLTQAIRSALVLQGDAIEKQGIQISIEVAPALDQVTLSHNRLLQALINALKNSIEAIVERKQHAAIEGRIDGFINIRAEAIGNDRLRLSVADNGAGFDAAAHADLFRFGYSTKQRGSGFGLHATAVFVQEAGGQVSLESDGPDQGARLVMELPCRARAPRQ